MGVFRFLLAALVVLFHFGGLSWIVGRVAVHAFYCVSGYLIFQVLDRVYLHDTFGSARFLANRVVRLAPLYIAYAALTALLLMAAAPVMSSALAGAGGPRPDAAPAELLRRTLTFAPIIERDAALPILRFDPPLIPQGWSIGVEILFYLLAPVVVFTTRRRPIWMTAWLAVAALVTGYAFHVAGADFDRFQVDVYKNAVASAMVFFVGGACYYVRRAWGPIGSAPILWAVVAVWLAFLTVPSLSGGSFPLPSAAVFAARLWVTIVVTCLVLLSPLPWWRAADKAAGNLCYGVYLNHFIAAAAALPIAVPVGIAPNTLTFGLLVVAGATALSGLTYLAIEHPFDQLRSRIRRTVISETLQPAPATERWALGVATVLACLSFFVGPGVERLNGAATLPLSGPFHIRWKPGVSDSSRHVLEAQLGLVNGGPVMRDPRRRTYEYRLRQPTRARVRALLAEPAVEDTARVDIERYEIAQ
jgi:peptidoglycan/LPS O-acetylase OafA/YrhL